MATRRPPGKRRFSAETRCLAAMSGSPLRPADEQKGGFMSTMLGCSDAGSRSSISSASCPWTSEAIRLDDSTLLIVAMPDGTLDDVAVLVDSATLDGEGVLAFGEVPEGFGVPVPGVGDTWNEIVADGGLAVLGLVLEHDRTGTEVGIEIADTGADRFELDDATTIGVTGRRTLGYGLFRERTLVWARDGLVIRLDHLAGDEPTDEELVALAESLVPVDEKSWTERVDGIIGYQGTWVDAS